MSDERGKRETRSVEDAIEIAAAADDVWRALTEARELERWFPLEARVEPGIGGTIFMSWKNEYAGDSKVVTWEPGRHLRTTWGFEGEGPDKVVQFTDYFIEAKGGATVLRVVTSGFPVDPSWDDWFEGTRRGWSFQLHSLKHYLERHPGENRQVIYLRRRVRLPEVDVWSRLTGLGGFALPPGSVMVAGALPNQVFAHVPALGDSLLLLSPEVCTHGADYRDATVWFQGYGLPAERLAALRSDWTALLERLFPGGEMV